MSKARYIVIEGLDGAGKTTQVDMLVEYLRSKGKKVLQTKEPGSPHSPLTMKLRGIMLDAQYEPEMTVPARELISQAIRSIHLEKVITPALEEYDYIIQDRGIMSGFAYGQACGMDYYDIDNLTNLVIDSADLLITKDIKYNDVIFLNGDPERLLARARAAKQEFAAGDAIEAKGSSFAREVAENFKKMIAQDDSIVTIDVEDKTPEQVFENVKKALKLKG